MRHDWLIDVLTDLRKFAQREGFSRLAEQIDDTLIVATGEIRRAEAKCAPVPGDPVADVRRLPSPRPGRRRP